MNWPATETSRSVTALHPAFRTRYEEFLQEYVDTTKVALLTYCTTRSMADQQDAYNRHASNAKPGWSFHQWGLAADSAPLYHGKILWDVMIPGTSKMHPLWTAYGELAIKHGLEWAGNWKSFKEFNHVQYTDGLSLQVILAKPSILEILT